MSRLYLALSAALLYLDDLVCALVTRHVGMTLSGRAGAALKLGGPRGWRVAGRALDALIPGHCERARTHDIARMAESLGVLHGMMRD